MPNLIYIMGTGRSATTILEILISNNPSVAGVGEVTHIFRDGLCLNDICSCGENAKRCPLWGEVFKHSAFAKKSAEHWAKLFHRFDWHNGFPRQMASLFSKSETEEYRTANDNLFKGVSDITGCGTIVDSSKYAARAIALSKIFPGKVKVVCLTRSPGGLINAFKRTDAEEQKPKKVHSTVLYYAVVTLCCRIAMTIIGKRNCVVVNFEELMRQPDRVLEKIEVLTGVSLTEAKMKIVNGDYFKIGHIVTGNRLRKKGKVKLRPAVSKDEPGNKIEYIAEKAMLLFGRALGFHY